MLGLPDGVTALLFDLDGVLTDTAVVHKAAWKEMFDAFLKERGEPEFTGSDYDRSLDGKPRYDGVSADPGSVRYLEAARDAGLRRAVCSSSANAADVLRVTGLEKLIEER